MTFVFVLQEAEKEREQEMRKQIEWEKQIKGKLKGH